MRIERVWEKPGPGNPKGYWAWLIRDTHLDRSDNTTYTVSGCGRSPAEARADLLCQKGRCNMKHAKKYQPRGFGHCDD